MSEEENNLTITKRFYDQLDSAGRQEMRYYTHRRMDAYVAGVLIIGFSSWFLSMLWLARSEIPVFILAAVGLNLLGLFWRRFWYTNTLLRYMKEFEDQRI